jgi:hypothetical protein
MLLVMVDWFDVDVCNFSLGYDLLLYFFALFVRALTRDFLSMNEWYVSPFTQKKNKILNF